LVEVALLQVLLEVAEKVKVEVEEL